MQGRDNGTPEENKPLLVTVDTSGTVIAMFGSEDIPDNVPSVAPSQNSSSYAVVPQNFDPEANNLLKMVEEYEYVHKHNRTQIVGQKILGFTKGIAPVIAVAGELTAQDMMPQISVPYNMMTSVAIIHGCMVTRKMVEMLISKEAPLDYFRHAGKGNILIGTAKEAAKFVASTLPSIGGAIGYAYLVETYRTKAEQDTDIKMMVLFSTMSAPFVHHFLVGAPSRIMYGLTKRLIECCVPGGKKNIKIKENTNRLQDVLSFLFRAYETLAFSEMVRLGITTVGPASLVHDAMFPLLPIVLDQFVLPPMRYLTHQVHPFENMPTPWKYVEPESSLIIYDERNEVQKKSSASDAAKTVALYTVCAGTVLAIAWSVNNALMNNVEDRDPEIMSTPQRVGYEAALLGGAMFVSEVAQRLASSAIKKISGWCSTSKSGFFSRNNNQDADTENLLEKPKKTGCPWFGRR